MHSAQAPSFALTNRGFPFVYGEHVLNAQRPVCYMCEIQTRVPRVRTACDMSQHQQHNQLHFFIRFWLIHFRWNFCQAHLRPHNSVNNSGRELKVFHERGTFGPLS